MKRFMWAVFLIVLSIYYSSCQIFQKTAKNKNTNTASATIVKKDSLAGKGPKSYEAIITSKAITDVGLLTVHKVEGNYFFELPASLLGKELLVVSRISHAAAGVRINDGYQGYAGDPINENIISFVKGPEEKIFIKKRSYWERATDSTSNGMYNTVKNSNLQPIVGSFDIKAYGKDSASYVIDVTDYLKGDNTLLFFDPNYKKSYKLTALQADKSYVDTINSYPINTEIKTIKTYTSGDDLITFGINTSMMLLPADPMKPRDLDNRVGYFHTGFVNFDAPKGVEYQDMITRWRLEPKPADVEKYLRGELVEPQKPIVFYIDPATPKKWIPYLIQGVNDWQKAFEKAGFKNAIYALEAPKDDPEWSLYDARHNAIIYMPAAVENAMGPHIHDPRTGEILEAHVHWYHNIQKLLHRWYMIQAGLSDAGARKMVFDEELMGQLIRFVSSHEVGHTLGLAHNMGSSNTIPVEKLRDKKWVEENGHTPSIMDYARFNYVAQPEDNISRKGIFPRIGVYDDWAIEWGYKWFPGNRFKSKEDEKSYMNNWVIDELKEDKRKWFGPQQFLILDPRSQIEDLGDDAVKASTYGMTNLKRIVPQLLTWTREKNADYSSASEMYDGILKQYRLYLGHVAGNIGTRKWTNRTVEEGLNQLEYLSKKQQRDAVKFLNDYLFDPPQWLFNKELKWKAGVGNVFGLSSIQQSYLGELLGFPMYENLTNNAADQNSDRYTYSALLDDLRGYIWKEVSEQAPVSLQRQTVQSIYVDILTKLFDAPWPAMPFVNLQQETKAKANKTSYYSLVRNHIKELNSLVKKNIPHITDKVTRDHLLDISDRLEKSLTNNNKEQGAASPMVMGFNNAETLMEQAEKMLKRLLPEQGCWEDNTDWLNYLQQHQSAIEEYFLRKK